MTPEELVAAVTTAGRIAHPGDEWASLPAEVHLAAAHRHLAKGAAVDDETGLPHLAHAAWRLAAAALVAR